MHNNGLSGRLRSEAGRLSLGRIRPCSYRVRISIPPTPAMDRSEVYSIYPGWLWPCGEKRPKERSTERVRRAVLRHIFYVGYDAGDPGRSRVEMRQCRNETMKKQRVRG